WASRGRGPPVGGAGAEPAAATACRVFPAGDRRRESLPLRHGRARPGLPGAVVRGARVVPARRRVRVPTHAPERTPVDLRLTGDGAASTGPSPLWSAEHDPATRKGGLLMTHRTSRAVRFLLAVVCTVGLALTGADVAGAWGGHRQSHSLWSLYYAQLRQAKYVDLTHTITPSIPVWAGFGPSLFAPAKNPTTGVPYTYAADGFQGTAYQLQTDQLGTRLYPTH